MSYVTPEEIDACLPQTQCGLCGYGGCMPYAEAIVFENAAINLCPPGGIKTLIEIATLIEKDPTPYLNEMEKKIKPKTLAVIREAECIGCTKCIQACPVDAILGASKQMHTIIASECTGCELCVPACPVDCIDLVAVNEFSDDKAIEYNEVNNKQKDHARKRFNARNIRLAKEKAKKTEKELQKTLKEKQNYIQAAIARVKAKKL